MPAGKGFSGKDGSAFSGAVDATAATKILEVTKWTIDPTAAVSKYCSNATFGHKRAVVGVRDTKGTIEIKVDGDGGAQLGPGEELSLQLSTGTEVVGLFDIKHAVIIGAPVDCDVNDGEIVGLTYNFEASDCTGTGVFASFGSSGIDPA